MLPRGRTRVRLAKTDTGRSGRIVEQTPNWGREPPGYHTSQNTPAVILAFPTAAFLRP